MENNNMITATATLTREDILALDWKEIGEFVLSPESECFKAFARTAATICRRAFKPADVILISVLDEDGEGETGIAFTTNGIYYWDDDTHTGVKYSDIADVDYDDDSVRLTLKQKNPESSPEPADCRSLSDLEKALRKDNTNALTADIISAISPLFPKKRSDLFCIPCVGEDNDLEEEEIRQYARELYNFICDIVEI
jgi:hypothetical protein